MTFLNFIFFIFSLISNLVFLLVVGLGTMFTRESLYRSIALKQFNIALNLLHGDCLNWLLLRKEDSDDFLFGDPEDNFVSCLAKNFEWETLNFFGRLVYHALNLRNRYYCFSQIRVTSEQEYEEMGMEFWQEWSKNFYGRTDLLVNAKRIIEFPKC